MQTFYQYNTGIELISVAVLGSIYCDTVTYCIALHVSHLHIVLDDRGIVSDLELMSGWSIVYIEGSQFIISPKYCINFSEDLLFLCKYVMLHYFIWVLTVCKSTYLSSSPQKG